MTEREGGKAQLNPILVHDSALESNRQEPAIGIGEDFIAPEEYSCDVCSESYMEQSFLMQHLKCRHKQLFVTSHQCPVCHKYYSAAWVRDQHVRAVHKRIKRHLCPSCGKLFFHAHRLRRHIQSQHDEKTLDCKYCHKKFALAYDLTLHTNAHEGIFRYSCDICDKGFTDRRNLVKHRKQHPLRKDVGQPGLHMCDVCGDAFTWQSFLMKHLQTCHQQLIVNDYQCAICHKYYKSGVQLHKHMQRGCHVRKQPGLCHCDVCGDAYMLQDSLVEHMQSIHKQFIVTDYQCSQCHKYYKTALRVKIHIQLVHSHIHKVECSLCGQMFNHRENLVKHIQSQHEGIRYDCQYCNKQFTAKATLSVHLKSHEGTRPHICDICGMGFNVRRLLNNHRIKHIL